MIYSGSAGQIKCVLAYFLNTTSTITWYVISAISELIGILHLSDYKYICSYGVKPRQRWPQNGL